MATKKPKEVIVWRLRVRRDLVERVKVLANAERRSTTQQAAVLIEKALEAR
jgi:hypothetical protein